MDRVAARTRKGAGTLVLALLLGGIPGTAEPLRRLPLSTPAPKDAADQAMELADRFQEAFLLEEHPDRIRIEWRDRSCELSWEDWQAYREHRLDVAELASRMRVAELPPALPATPLPGPSRSRGILGSPAALAFGGGGVLLLGSGLLAFLLWKGRRRPGDAPAPPPPPSAPPPALPPPLPPSPPSLSEPTQPPRPTMLMPLLPAGPEDEGPRPQGRPAIEGDLLLLPGPQGATLRVPIGSRLTMGREPDNVLVLTDPSVSRRHAVIESFPGGCVLTDLGSSNGTRLNGIKVERPTLLRVGDIMNLGGVSFTVREG